MVTPNAANSPPLIDSHKYKVNEDPARRIAYSRFKFPLPKITGGGKTFVWPIGPEGFTRSGSATLAIHKYLGRGYVDVHIIHRDEAHFEMNGTFAGLTSAKNMHDLIEVITAPKAKFLSVPGVFPNIQTVYAENYSFPHDKEDRTHSIDYSISFIRTTTGDKVDSKSAVLHESLSAEGPSVPRGAPTRADSDRVVSTSDGMRTLRGIADRVYGDADKWRALVDLNADVLADYNRGFVGPIVNVIPDFQLATMRFEIGTRLRY